MICSHKKYTLHGAISKSCKCQSVSQVNKGNNKITELRTILQMESKNS